MRIVIIHTDFRLYWPARLSALSRFLDAEEHSLHIIEIAGKGSPYSFAQVSAIQDELDWICLFPDRGMETISGKEASLALFKKLDELQPDVVMGGAIAFPSGVTAVRWAKSRNKPVVIFDNARLQDVPRSRMVNFIKRCIYRNVDAVLSPASSQAPAFEHWGVERERIFFGLNVIDNGWFASRVAMLKPDLQRIREELGLPGRFILGVGRLIEKKNWIMLVSAFAKARQVHSDQHWSLVVVGDGPMKGELEKFSKSSEYGDVILRPFATQEELCRYYALASSLVLPSRFGETWGLVVNEAMACGLPVLVSRQCGCADTLVEDGRNGYLFSPDNKIQIVETLSHFMRIDDTQRFAMGERSKEIISEWSLEKFCQGAWGAIQYARKHHTRAPSFFDALIIRCWKGRYRPV